jgi:hypothetical protein
MGSLEAMIVCQKTPEHMAVPIIRQATLHTGGALRGGMMGPQLM